MRQSFIIGVGIAAVITLLMWCSTIAPQVASIRTLRKELSLLMNGPLLKGGSGGHQEEIPSMIKPYTTDVEGSSLLESIAQEAQRSGMIIKSFTPMAEKRRQVYLAKPVRLVIAGDYRRLLLCLKQLMMLSPWIGIEELLIEEGVNSPLLSTPELKVSVVAATYHPLKKTSHLHRSTKPPDNSELSA